MALFTGVPTPNRRWQRFLPLPSSQLTQPIKDLRERSKGIKLGLIKILIEYELGSGSGRLLMGWVGPVKRERARWAELGHVRGKAARPGGPAAGFQPKN
jgi:hypothetical protein